MFRLYEVMIFDKYISQIVIANEMSQDCDSISVDAWYFGIWEPPQNRNADLQCSTWRRKLQNVNMFFLGVRSLNDLFSKKIISKRAWIQSSWEFLGQLHWTEHPPSDLYEFPPIAMLIDQTKCHNLHWLNYGLSVTISNFPFKLSTL